MALKALQKRTIPVAAINHSRGKVQYNNTQTMPPIQLKTGFEIELDVPAYIEPPEVRRPTLTNKVPLSSQEILDIQSFLAGGLEYSYTYEVHPLGFYHLTADHSEYQKRHLEFVNKLVEKGLVSSFFFRTMTNLEYVTPPFDEISENLILGVADSIKNHASATADKSKQKIKTQIDAPARNLFTGVPEAALKKLVGEDQELKGMIDELTTKIVATSYFQESTGVLPSEIPAFFDKAADEIYAKYKKQLALAKFNLTEEEYNQLQENKRIEVDKSTTNRDVLEKVPAAYAKAALLAASVVLGRNFPLTKDTPEKFAPSIRGFLTLAGQYLLASILEGYQEYTGSGGTEKNRVSYLSRVAMEHTRQALPSEAIPYLETSWKNEQKGFVTHAEEIGAIICKNARFTKKSSGNFRHEVLGEKRVDNLNKIILGEEAVSIRPGSLLKVEPTEGGDESLKLPGEKLIPMEDRDLGRKLSDSQKQPGQIANVLMTRWRNAYIRRKSSVKSEYSELLQSLNGGLDNIKLLNNVVVSYLGNEAAEKMKELVEKIQPLVNSPDSLDEKEASKLVADFSTIAQLKLVLANQGATSEKKKTVINYMVNFFSQYVEGKIAGVIAEVDSAENRLATHKSISKELTDLKGISNTAGHWEPIIESTTIEKYGIKYYVTYKGEMRILSNIKGDTKGDTYFIGDNAKICPVLKKEGDQVYKLKFATLANEHKTWELVED